MQPRFGFMSHMPAGESLLPNTVIRPAPRHMTESAIVPLQIYRAEILSTG